MERSTGRKKRIQLLDEIRGFAVLCMVVYHALYTAVNLFDIRDLADLLRFFTPAEPYFAGAFILMSGFACQLSSANLERGVKLLIVAGGISLVTYTMVPQCFIAFGVIHMLAICIIIFALTEDVIERIPTIAGLLISAILYVFTAEIHRGYIGISWMDLHLFTISKAVYSQDFLFPIGIVAQNFRSADYFPLVPWAFVFFFGTFLGRSAQTGLLPRFVYSGRSRFLAGIGAHALLIYIFHQPIIYGGFWLWARCVA